LNPYSSDEEAGAMGDFSLGYEEAEVGEVSGSLIGKLRYYCPNHFFKIIGMGA
jgi:hypothetical protein